jgi:hypothetical protein
MDAWLQNIEALALARALRGSAWAYPVLEWMHLVGLATLFGTLLLVDLRVLGVIRHAAAGALDGIALPWTLFGFALVAITGTLMFSTRAVELAHNDAFLAKLGLLAAAGANAAWFHLRASGRRRDATARIQAAASMVVWIAVIGLGRAIAYV